MSAVSTEINIGNATSTRSERLSAAVLALALGVLFVGVIGFAQIDAVHNAAHDGRHSFAFPCH